MLWSGGGALGSWYEAEGGPIGLWRAWAERAEGQAVAAGHFFPEERPEQTAELLSQFLVGAAVLA